MATYKQLIKRSLRLIQAIPKGDFEPAADELADAFIALENLFDEMSSERFGQYTIVQESVTLTNGDNSYSIGTGGDLNTARPKKILNAWIRQDNTDYPVKIIAREDYANIPDKTDSGRPYLLYYEESYPLGRVDLYYTPDAAYTLFLESWKEITKPTAATDTVALPSEYTQFIVNQLAVDLAPEYGTQAAPSVQQKAARARRTLKNIHSSNVPRACTDPLRSGLEYDVDGDVYV